MITGLIISMVQLVLNTFNNLLPNLTVPSWMTADNVGSWATDIGDLLSPVTRILPIDAILTVLEAVLTLLPVIIAYVIFQWAWSHVPTIFGFGTQ